MEENTPNEGSAASAEQPTPIYNADSALKQNTAPIALSPTDTDSALAGRLTTVIPKDGKRNPKPIATDQDIANAVPPALLKIDNGLYLQISTIGKKKTFRYRSYFNHNQNWVTIGQYPTMSIANAKEIVEKEYRTEVESARQAKSNLEWKQGLTKSIKKTKTKSDIEKHPSFDSEDDESQFILNLSGYRGSTEIRLAIWLQMLIPSRSADLLTAKWSDFNLDANQWSVKAKTPPTSQPDIYSPTPPHIEYISTAAHSAIQELGNLPGHTPCLFPSLCAPSISTTERNTIIDKAIVEIWMKYPINSSSFLNLFITTANRNSYFKPEFIKAMVTHKYGANSIHNNQSYVPQKKALAEWWGMELNRLRTKINKAI